jgi:hypothetical protein
LELRVNIFGDEHDLSGLTYTLVLIGIGFWSDESEQCGSVRRRNRHPSVARSNTRVVNQMKPKLVQIESQTFVLIPNKNAHALNAEIRLQRIRTEVRAVDPTKQRRTAHGL